MSIPIFVAVLLLSGSQTVSAEIIEADICVLGGTSSGVVAAVQASHMGKTVVVAEPGRHLGGLSSGGLGATDIGNKGAIGGLSREFYARVARYYAEDSAWTWESHQDYFTKRGSSQVKASDPLTSAAPTMWTFEPHVAERIFDQMLKEAKVPVHYRQRLAAVRKSGARIVELAMESGAVFRAKVFIDATYEGDPDAQWQDGHQQQRCLLYRFHRCQLRLPRGRLPNPRADRQGA